MGTWKMKADVNGNGNAIAGAVYNYRVANGQSVHWFLDDKAAGELNMEGLEK